MTDARFSTKRDDFERWLRSLKRELETPDYWGKLLEERQTLSSAFASEDNDLFAAEEKQQIIASLDAVKADLLRSFEFHKQQNEMLEQGFEEIKTGLDRVGRKDLYNQAIGVVMNIIVAASFSPDAAAKLFHQVSTAINAAFVHVLELAGPVLN